LRSLTSNENQAVIVYAIEKRTGDLRLEEWGGETEAGYYWRLTREKGNICLKCAVGRGKAPRSREGTEKRGGVIFVSFGVYFS